MTAPASLKPGPRHFDDASIFITYALFDVDNTLVGNASPDLPSERFRAAAAAAQAHGITVAIASARPVSKTAHIMDHIQAGGLSITCNGAQIVRSADRTVVAEWPISPEACAAVLAHLNTLDVEYWINDDGVDHFPADGGKTYARQTDIWDAESPRVTVPGYAPGKPFVINLHNLTHAQTDEVAAFVRDYGDPELTTLIAHEFPQPDGSTLYDQFIVNTKANKRHALHELLRLQDLDISNLLAVGDGRNDRDYVGAAGAGVAMGNSAKETLAVATHIAPDQADDGAAVALEYFIERR